MLALHCSLFVITLSPLSTLSSPFYTFYHPLPILITVLSPFVAFVTSLSSFITKKDTTLLTYFVAPLAQTSHHFVSDAVALSLSLFADKRRPILLVYAGARPLLVSLQEAPHSDNLFSVPLPKNKPHFVSVCCGSFPSVFDHREKQFVSPRCRPAPSRFIRKGTPPSCEAILRLVFRFLLLRRQKSPSC